MARTLEIQITEMHPEHRDSIIELVCLLPQWFNEKARERYIPVDLRLHEGYVAHAGDQLLGFVTYTSKYGAGIISWIGIHPNHHREGIGRRLLQTVERSLASLGAQRAIVETVGWSDPEYLPYGKTRAFYKALGYNISKQLETGTEAGHQWQMCEFSKDLT